MSRMNSFHKRETVCYLNEQVHLESLSMTKHLNNERSNNVLEFLVRYISLTIRNMQNFPGGR